MDRSTNYTACAFPLMRPYCMGAHTGPAGISTLHTRHAHIDVCAQLRRACAFSVTGNGELVTHFSCLLHLRYPVAHRDHRYLAVKPAVLCLQKFLFTCSVKGACFLWNCMIKCTYLIF